MGEVIGRFWLGAIKGFLLELALERQTAWEGRGFPFTGGVHTRVKDQRILAPDA